MKTNSISKTAWDESHRVAGPVTRERVNDRTRELAALAGRIPPEVAQGDYEQAKREVTGEKDIDRQEAALNARQATILPTRVAR